MKFVPPPPVHSLTFGYLGPLPSSLSKWCTPPSPPPTNCSLPPKTTKWNSFQIQVKDKFTNEHTGLTPTPARWAKCKLTNERTKLISTFDALQISSFHSFNRWAVSNEQSCRTVTRGRNHAGLHQQRNWAFFVVFFVLLYVCTDHTDYWGQGAQAVHVD